MIASTYMMSIITIVINKKWIFFSLLLCTSVYNQAENAPTQQKLEMSFKLLDEKFVLDNRTLKGLRFNKALIPLAENAIHSALEFYSDNSELMVKAIKALYIQGNYYLRTERFAVSMQKLMLAKELCEKYCSNTEKLDSSQICIQLAPVCPMLPAYYALILYHIGLNYLSQNFFSTNAYLDTKDIAAEYLKKACDIRNIIDSSPEYSADDADASVISDTVIFKRALGIIYLETKRLGEAENLYQALLKIDDPFNKFMVYRRLVKLYQLKGLQDSEPASKEDNYRKALDCADECLQLMPKNFAQRSFVYREIGKLYCDVNNPFNDLEKAKHFLRLAEKHCLPELRFTASSIKKDLCFIAKILYEKELSQVTQLRWDVIEDEAADSLRVSSNYTLQVLSYMSLGDLYLEKKSFIIASALFGNGLSLCKRLPHTDAFQKMLYVKLALTEQLFLNEHNVIEKVASSSLSQNTISFHTSKLESLRGEIKNLLDKNKPIEIIYSCVVQKYKDIIRALIEEACLLLGPVPTQEYAFIAFGSIGHGFATPYSDFEFAIVLKDEQHKAYFKVLSELLHIKINALQEAPIALFRIPALAWIKREDGPSPCGFMLDSGNVLPHCPFNEAVELIGTPQHVANIFSLDQLTANKKSAFYQTAFIFGQEDLVLEYKQEVEKFLNTNNRRSELVNKMIEEDLENYYKRLGSELWLKQGQSYYFKLDFYRPFETMLDALALKNGVAVASPWQVITELYSTHSIDDTMYSMLKNLLNEIGLIRLSLCIHNKSQDWTLYPLQALHAVVAGPANKYFIDEKRLTKIFNDLIFIQSKIFQ